jgi:hypothetical protein
MPRRATSPEEIAQVARVHALLGGIDIAPPAYIVVTVATRKTQVGQLLQLRVGNTQRKDGSWFSYGAVTLATGTDKVEIDYLDIVWAERGQPPKPPKPARRPRRGAAKADTGRGSKSAPERRTQRGKPPGIP